MDKGSAYLVFLFHSNNVAVIPHRIRVDEATSAVDMDTDGHIQQATRSEFGSNMSSLLSIAHRLSTVADFDNILVMGEGHIIEIGSPRELLGIEGSAFQDLVRQSGETRDVCLQWLDIFLLLAPTRAVQKHDIVAQ